MSSEQLPRRMVTLEGTKNMIRYWSSNCGKCGLKSKCTTGKERRVTLWEHGKVLGIHEQHMNENSKMMQLRKQTVEHPFGAIKSWMGMTHFKTKTLSRVSTEMSLHVLAYNITRMINIMGLNHSQEQ